MGAGLLVDFLVELFTRLEADSSLRLDLDGLARLRIASDAGFSLARAPRAEADECDPLPLLQRRRDALREGFDRRGCGGAGDAGIRRALTDQLPVVHAFHLLSVVALSRAML